MFAINPAHLVRWPDFFFQHPETIAAPSLHYYCWVIRCLMEKNCRNKPRKKKKKKEIHCTTIRNFFSMFFHSQLIFFMVFFVINRKPEPGRPASRAGSCRVCLKSFKPDDFSRTCYECQFKVCDDCACYSETKDYDDPVRKYIHEYIYV